MMMAHQIRASSAMLALVASRLLLALANYYLLCYSASLLTLPAVHGSLGISRDDLDDALEPPDSDDLDEQVPRVLPNRNKKRVLTNTKLFYFMQNPRHIQTSESQRSQDLMTAKSDCNRAVITQRRTLTLSN